MKTTLKITATLVAALALAAALGGAASAKNIPDDGLRHSTTSVR